MKHTYLFVFQRLCSGGTTDETENENKNKIFNELHNICFLYYYVY